MWILWECSQTGTKSWCPAVVVTLVVFAAVFVVVAVDAADSDAADLGDHVRDPDHVVSAAAAVAAVAVVARCHQ